MKHIFPNNVSFEFNYSGAERVVRIRQPQEGAPARKFRQIIQPGERFVRIRELKE